MQRDALAFSHPHRVPAFLATFALSVSVFFACAYLATERHSWVYVVAGAVVIAGLLAFDRFYVQARFVDAQRARLEALHWPVDWKVYLLRLGKRSSGVRVRITAQFEPGAVASNRRAFVRDALLAATDAEFVDIEGDEMTLESKMISTSHMSRSGETPKTKYGNAPVHRWTMKCVDEALPLVHADFPITSVAVQVVGGFEMD